MNNVVCCGFNRTQLLLWRNVFLMLTGCANVRPCASAGEACASGAALVLLDGRQNQARVVSDFFVLRGRGMAVVVVSDKPVNHYLARTLWDAGVRALIVCADTAELEACHGNLERGERYMTGHARDALDGADGTELRALQMLTGLQLGILYCIRQNMSAEETAEALGTTPRYVYNLTYRVNRALAAEGLCDATDRLAAVTWSLDLPPRG